MTVVFSVFFCPLWFSFFFFFPLCLFVFLNPFMYWWDCSLSFKNCLTNTNNVDLQNKSDTLTWQAAMEIFFLGLWMSCHVPYPKTSRGITSRKNRFKWLLTEITDGIIQIVKDVGTVSAFSYNWIHQFSRPRKSVKLKIRKTVLWGFRNVHVCARLANLRLRFILSSKAP